METTKKLLLPLDWELRDYQRPLWEYLRYGGRRAIVIAHRRWGKDDVVLHYTCMAAHKRVANYWHLLPTYEQCRKAIWEAINPHTGKLRIDEAFPPEIRARTDQQSMTIGLKNGSIWKVVGSDRPDTLVGAAPAGICFSEWALANPSSWAYLAPILAENDGWAVFITTPRGRNHAYATLEMAQRQPGWFAEVSTVDDTGAISPERIEEQRIEYHGIYGVDAGDALIEQEYWCSFEAALLGAVWGKELADAAKDGRIGHFPKLDGVPIHCAWDIGVGANMAIWVFQEQWDKVRIIDYISGFGIGFPSHCAELESRGYVGGTDWVPHDAKVAELGTEKTRVETLISLGRKPKLVPRHGLDDGISGTRQTIEHLVFDEEACKKGLEAVRQYQYEWDDKKKDFGLKPRHDWTSHPADALRYRCMAWRSVEQPPKEVVLPKDPLGRSIKKLDLPKPLSEYTYDEFHKTQPRRRTRV